MPDSVKMLSPSAAFNSPKLSAAKSPAHKARKESVSEDAAPPPMELTAPAPSAPLAVAEQEPLLKENPNRHVIFPIEFGDLWAKYKGHMSVFWIPEEIDLSKDPEHWNNKLTDGERHFIKYILGFFAGSDGIVMENLASRFMREIQVPEARFFYACQNLMETVHSETYSLLIDTYIDNKQEKLDILRAISTIPVVQKKAEWALQWVENAEASFATRLLAFAVVEGIFFSGAFCSIYWLKQRGLMPGLTVSNELISRDEGLHTEFACLLYSKLVNKLSKQDAHKIIREAVKIEKQFITKALPCELIGMNSKLMAEYIEFVADRLSLQLGYPKLYHAKNPFDFMERISLEGKGNFFECRITNYAKANTQGKSEDKRFATDMDF